MEKSKKLHIVNLYNYLEKNELYKYILENNKIKEPNMEFCIWTENDQFIKDTIQNSSYCKYYMSLNRIKQVSIYLDMCLLYKYGGTIYEIDYEFIENNALYNIFLNETLYLPSLNQNSFSVTNGFINYIAYPNNYIYKKNIDYFDEHYKELEDVYYYSDFSFAKCENLIKYNYFTNEEIENLKKEQLKKKDIKIYHYSQVISSDKIEFFTLKDFINSELKKNNKHTKYIVFADTKDKDFSLYKIILDNYYKEKTQYENDSFVQVVYSEEDFNHFKEVLSKVNLIE